MLDGLNDGRMDRVRPRPEKRKAKNHERKTFQRKFWVWDIPRT